MKKFVINTNIVDSKRNATSFGYRQTAKLIFSDEILAFPCN